MDFRREQQCKSKYSYLLAWCLSDVPLNQFFSSSGKLYGRSSEVIDDEKYRKFGFKPDTRDYGNCRFKLKEIRTIRESISTSGAATDRSNVKVPIRYGPAEMRGG